MVGDELTQYTYTYLMGLALDVIDPSFDKRQGSIIYDALAPFCYRMADFFMKIRNIYTDTFVSTAGEENLDKRVAEQGLTRYQASSSKRKGYVLDASGNLMSVDIGSRFSTISDTDPINYEITDYYKINSSSEYDPDGTVLTGYYVFTCETTGTVGNEYSGELLNISNINGIGSAFLETVITPARDVETDDELRQRYFEFVLRKSFGGNIAQYVEEVGAIDGVGGVQVYPAWQGGGTVKLSVISASYDVISPEFIAVLKNTLDPPDDSGKTGLGLGTVPIGHQVTVATPTPVTINIEATVLCSSGYEVATVLGSVTEALSDYMLELRKAWHISDEKNKYKLAIYIARISSIILTVAGVVNVSDIKINGLEEDLDLTQNPDLQELPFLGEVTLS